MKTLRKIAVIAFAVVFALLPIAPMHASTLTDTPVTVGLSMTVPESLSVSATPSNLTFTYDGVNSATGSGPVTVVTSWDLASTRTAVWTLVYFSNTTALTDGAGHNIPTSEFYMNGNGNNGGACNQTYNPPNGVTFSVPAGADCDGLGYQTVSGGGPGTQTNTFTASLTGLGILNPATYTGTINISAIAE